MGFAAPIKIFTRAFSLEQHDVIERDVILRDLLKRGSPPL
jgi:hypothetical protein